MFIASRSRCQLTGRGPELITQHVFLRRRGLQLGFQQFLEPVVAQDVCLHEDQVILVLDNVLEEIDYRVQIQYPHLQQSLQPGETFYRELISFSILSLD